MKAGDLRTDCDITECEEKEIDLPSSDEELAPCLPPKLKNKANFPVQGCRHGCGDLNTTPSKYRETTLDDNHAAQEKNANNIGDKVSRLTTDNTAKISACNSSVVASGEMPVHTITKSNSLHCLEYTQASSPASNRLTITNERTNPEASVDNNSLCEETYENVDELAIDESTPLKDDTSSYSCELVDCTDNHLPVVVIDTDLNQVELSWQRLLEEHKERRAKEAVVALNEERPRERLSPFRYKSWLLQLSHRRRFEILIAIGLFLWLAFFIVLAIFMNGPSSKSEDMDSDISTEHSHANQVPAINQSITINTSQFHDLNQWSSPTIVTTSSLQPLNSTKETSSLASTAQPKKERTILQTLSIFATAPPKDTDVLTDFENKKNPATPVSNTESSIFVSAGVERDYKSPETGSETKNSELDFTQMLQTNREKTATSIPVATVINPQIGADSVHTSSTQIQSLSDASTTKNVVFPNIEDNEYSLNLRKVLEGMKPNYQIGLGRADITGPAADVNMMGYANPGQVAGGVHTRQYARTFLIAHGSSRVLFVNIDACMGSTLLKLEVLKRLQTLYGSLYAADNLCISGTHTHSAPAGFLQDVLFQITSMGYVPETLKAMVEGIVESIQIAHSKLAPGYILLNKGELLDSNINRSPAAYLNNPESERKMYQYNVDKEMILLKFLDASGKGIGMLNWFAVHCTSMNNSNTLISSDNKGYAEMLFEQEMNPGAIVGDGEFVAAFAQSNEGDVSPNTKGPHCIDTGLPCDNIHSTCDGKVQNCIASGPGKDMYESTEIIAKNQYRKALELYERATTFLTGPVQFVHQYVDMTNQTVVLNDTYTGHTCKPAMGFSFAAGTTDGPGAFDFKQGDKTGNLFWKAVRNFLHSPSKEQSDCHFPKPILVDTGEMNYPYSWQPEVVDTQVFRIGQLLISSVPGEFTTMSGRRLKDAVLQEFSRSNSSERFVSVIAGLANTYSDYISTFEEYHVQRYEGASTIFGPHTLSAYIQQYRKLATSLAQEKPLEEEAQVHDLLPKLMSFVPSVVMDSTPFGSNFGDVLIDANETYSAGNEIKVQFVSGNPRNSPSMNMTFLTVEKMVENNTWKVVRTDGNWDTKYIWDRSATLGKVRGLSEATIIWNTSPDTPSGHYRINHYGHYKYFWNGNIYGYRGTSKTFFVDGKS